FQKFVFLCVFLGFAHRQPLNEVNFHQRKVSNLTITQRHKKEAIAELEEAVRRREAQAMARIAQAEMQAMAEVRNLAVDIVIAASQKLIADSLSPAAADALVDQAIRDLPRKLQ
ncbi:MAG: hypothetical protein H7840_16480, partial [Alphaproteobacteria bacterium]